uniref:(northern house mosquito) hypothetical protein n=1 Tax=Culex pipiens TaxID=7175 RepID=A0A8D8KNG1_CULPI
MPPSAFNRPCRPPPVPPRHPSYPRNRSQRPARPSPRRNSPASFCCFRRCVNFCSRERGKARPIWAYFNPGDSKEKRIANKIMIQNHSINQAEIVSYPNSPLIVNLLRCVVLVM